MQVKYPERSNTIKFWDTVHTEYPVRKFPETGVTSETVGRLWKEPPEVLKKLKRPVEEIKDYIYDYNITKHLTKSQSTLDYGAKISETQRFNKHTSCNENKYLYPPYRLISERPPPCTAHGTTEMRDSYKIPETPARLVTNKDQFKDPRSLRDAIPEPSRTKEIEPLDITHEGYEVYLDPYLTTNRLHHRPYTADQLSRPSIKKDIMTFHTYSKEPWVRSPKPKIEEWDLPIRLPKSIAFRTEIRQNYTPLEHNTLIPDYEEDVKVAYQQAMAKVPTLVPEEVSSIKRTYKSETSHYGSGRPLSSVIQQHKELNKRLEMRLRK